MTLFRAAGWTVAPWPARAATLLQPKIIARLTLIKATTLRILRVALCCHRGFATKVDRP
jgi:hypothetical protein